VDEPLTQPRYATRSQKWLRGSATVDAMLTMMELSNQPITPQRLASRQFPLQFLHEVAGAVMDVETGDMLEYCHLLKIPSITKPGRKHSARKSDS
jgi:hypothetical protein